MQLVSAAAAGTKNEDFIPFQLHLKTSHLRVSIRLREVYRGSLEVFRRWM